MTETLAIACAQLNPIVGDVAGNLDKARAAHAEAVKLGADLVVFPELFLCGYPPEDLVLKPAFQDACRAAAEAFAKETADGPAAIIGTPWAEEGKLYNAAVFAEDGAIAAKVFKSQLPTYGVFDGLRRFIPGPPPKPITLKGVKLGLMVCEDMWLPEPAAALAAAGAEIFIVPNGSPYRETAHTERFDVAKARVAAHGLPLVYVNQVGGQDELVFDGSGFALAADGAVASQAPAFEEGVFLTRWTKGAAGWVCTDGPNAPWPDGEGAFYSAVLTGVRDYVEKNRFPGVLIGLSGGIDSALTAAIAVDAFGPDRVRCVMLPSRYTSDESLQDAEQCAAALGVQYDIIAIEDAVKAFGGMLGPVFEGRAPDVTEENIQSRIRGVVLMALSNKFGHMLLTTGNKSEMSVGYATLYGDMNGGYNALKDVYKTDVFALSRWRNDNVPARAKGPAGLVIPERIITKPPSAELREDQKDEDSLPPYDVLDAILQGLVEDEKAVRDIVADGHDEATVRRIEHLLYIAEYKRRQAPPGPKVTSKNFGRDRRYPITNGFRDRG